MKVLKVFLLFVFLFEMAMTPLSYGGFIDDQVPILKAVRTGDKEKVFKLLDQDPTRIHQRGRLSYKTPLHVAIEADNPSLIATLVARGAGLLARDKKGRFPLKLLMEKGNHHVTQIALEKMRMPGERAFTSHLLNTMIEDLEFARLFVGSLFNPSRQARETQALLGRDTINPVQKAQWFFELLVQQSRIILGLSDTIMAYKKPHEQLQRFLRVAVKTTLEELTKQESIRDFRELVQLQKIFEPLAVAPYKDRLGTTPFEVFEWKYFFQLAKQSPEIAQALFQFLMEKPNRWVDYYIEVVHWKLFLQDLWELPLDLGQRGDLLQHLFAILKVRPTHSHYDYQFNMLEEEMVKDDHILRVRTALDEEENLLQKRFMAKKFFNAMSEVPLKRQLGAKLRILKEAFPHDVAFIMEEMDIPLQHPSFKDREVAAQYILDLFPMALRGRMSFSDLRELKRLVAFDSDSASLVEVALKEKMKQEIENYVRWVTEQLEEAQRMGAYAPKTFVACDDGEGAKKGAPAGVVEKEECTLCLTDFSKGDIYRCTGDGCIIRACAACKQTMLLKDQVDKKQVPLNCSHCRASWELKLLDELAGVVSAEELEAYRRRHVLEEYQRLVGGKSCSIPDCLFIRPRAAEMATAVATGAGAESVAGPLTCELCEEKICRDCEGKAHEGTCQDKAHMESLIAAGVVKKCPFCQVPSTRVEGVGDCNKIFCKRCGGVWNWVTGAAWVSYDRARSQGQLFVSDQERKTWEAREKRSVRTIGGD